MVQVVTEIPIEDDTLISNIYEHCGCWWPSNAKSQAVVLYLSKNIPISNIRFKYFLQNIKQEFSRIFI